MNDNIIPVQNDTIISYSVHVTGTLCLQAPRIGLLCANFPWHGDEFSWLKVLARGTPMENTLRAVLIHHWCSIEIIEERLLNSSFSVLWPVSQ